MGRVAVIVILSQVVLMIDGGNVLGKEANLLDQKLPPPKDVSIDAVAERSFTLVWKPPDPPSDKNVKLLGYQLSYSRTDRTERETAIMLPAAIHSKLVTKLKQGTEYAVKLAAVYPNFQLSEAPKLTVRTEYPVEELPVGDDSYPDKKISCNCSEEGMVACTRSVQDVVCTCYKEYTGQWCEACAPGYFRAGKECKPCFCNNITSTGECVLEDEGQVRCKSCQPGHRGDLCEACTAGYTWKENRCQPINCLSFTLCSEKDLRDTPGCQDCLYLENSLQPVAQKSNTVRTTSEGTVPLIAAIVTIGIILLIAASISCYRYWLRKHSPHLPFWSIEIRDDKAKVSKDCQYQHLDLATSRVIQVQAEDDEPTTVTNSPAKQISM